VSRLCFCVVSAGTSAGWGHPAYRVWVDFHGDHSDGVAGVGMAVKRAGFSVLICCQARS
jgi:hypothetical protein